MRSTQSMTKVKFIRLHPNVRTVCIEVNGRLTIFAYRGTLRIAQVSGKSMGRLLKDLSERVYKLNSRDAMASQGWRETGTGSTQPLQSHHITPRSKGRNDAKENLSGVAARTHQNLHEKRHLARGPEPE